MAATVSVMANLSASRPPGGGIEIDHRTSLAVCEGIGERLRDQLKPVTALPRHLEDLMNRLREIEDAPSIVPEAAMKAAMARRR
ncbi:putative protein OS=Afipia felis OX=1035 GN=BN961_01664 PE=4 SV=1 [Afipia felis]